MIGDEDQSGNSGGPYVSGDQGLQDARSRLLSGPTTLTGRDIDDAQFRIVDAAKFAYTQAKGQGLSHEEAAAAALQAAGSLSLSPEISGNQQFVKAAVDQGVTQVANPMEVTAGQGAAQSSGQEQGGGSFLGKIAEFAAMIGAFFNLGSADAEQAAYAGNTMNEAGVAYAGSPTLTSALERGPDMTPGMTQQQQVSKGGQDSWARAMT